MQAMQRNAATPQGASGLLGALSHKHDGRILDQLGEIFANNNSNAIARDGSKILGHVLGNRRQNVENAISQQSGINNSTVSQILKIAAPIVMGFLGKQQRQSAVSDANGLTNLLGGLVGGNFHDKGGNQNLFESILDADQDGSIIDDVAGAVLGQKTTA